VRAGETGQQAMHRELFEELGIRLPALAPAGAASGIWDGRRDTVQFFAARLEHLPELRWDNREIIGARLFTPDELAGLPVTGPVHAYLTGR
jgi:8-oxo-dGTP pyrophosphatase MutT (NUDIX family)